MSTPKKLFRLTRNLFRWIRKLYDVAVKALVNRVLRGLRRIGKRSRWANAGFALPTTIMVLLVVILLTTALVFRSFDRNRNAVFGRSEQVIQNTSTPALDRAKAKVTALLADPKLPRGTPPDNTLLEVMNVQGYTFKDETRLKLAFDINGDGTLESTSNTSDPNFDPKSDETLNTAWKYPVDTDGNGKFDAFTLYGIYWRTPPFTNQSSSQYRARTPMEARSLPQETSGVADTCKSAGLSAATSVQQGDWLKQGANLSKAFYVYAATVPITDKNQISPQPFTQAQFENNTKGEKAFSGLEYEQDRYRSGLNNTAIWYQDDLVINPGGGFRVNGRVFTNSNLLMAGFPGTGKFQFYQVSSKYSCFYEEANSQINVGGNVGTGDVSQSNSQEPATVDLYKGFGVDPDQTIQINDSTKSTNSAGGSLISFNQAAYEQRITLMRDAALNLCSGCSEQNPPSKATFNATYSDTDLQQSFADALDNNPGNNVGAYDLMVKQVELYLRNRTRHVPYAEVSTPDGTGALGSYTVSNVLAGGGNIEPPQIWREPLSGNSFNNTSSASVSIIPTELPQSNPQNRTVPNTPEQYIGDRLAVGNNLPALWKDSTTNNKYVGQSGEQQKYTDGTTWNDGGSRYRTTQVQALSDLGVTDRNGFWEQAAALNPAVAANNNTGGGGLRVITGAGIYVDGTTANGATFPRDARLPNRSSFLPAPTWDTRFVDSTGADRTKINPATLRFRAQEPIVVWPDLMPMTGGKQTGRNNVDIDNNNIEDSRQKGDLLMRATAVYDYVDAAQAGTTVNQQQPIACVSSYYDPTDSTTARNIAGLPDVSGGIDTDGNGFIDKPFGLDTLSPGSGSNAGKSNNGVVYSFPGRTGYQQELLRQARLVFPNGRIVNQPLKDALQKTRTNYTFADFSALDTAICAIAILNSQVQPNPIIPYGAIKESSFLDGREIKAIDTAVNTSKNRTYSINDNYDLPLEQRQPLEIRVTDINLRLLAQTPHGSFDSDGDGTPETEYLLPNSGIIYASRDDALADNSNISDDTRQSTDNNDTTSPSDFRLDETRRPNGIRLINGLRLARGDGNSYDVHEKGLILATNLPTYVRGTFNQHLVSSVTESSYSPGTNELEEFPEALASNWGNFYTRGNASGTDINKSFACRQGQPRCEGNGDQWRPATILADAITLQSNSFQDGYRSQGDFDLRNNAGSLSTGKQINNGFFDNSFITSANWSNTGQSVVNGTLVPTSDHQTSYLVNGVTPIQRRANVYAYGTEICRKIPVSECTAQDWTPLRRFSTAQSATGNDERYARRVAFVKALDTTNTYFKYYYDPEGYPQLDPNASPVGSRTGKSNDPVSNALWFLTRNASGARSYAGQVANTSDPFIFQPFYPNNPQLLRTLASQPQLPDLKWLRSYAAADQNSKAPFVPPNLQDITAIQNGNGAPTQPSTGETLQTRITAIFDQFNTKFLPRKLFQYPSEQQFLDFSKSNTSASNRTINLTGGGMMRVFSSSAAISINQSTPLRLTGDEGSVYVFLVNGNLTLLPGAKLDLGTGLGKTVLPDNVYWLVTGNVNLLRGSQLKGNVLATGSISLAPQATLEGRALTSSGTVTLQAPRRNQSNVPKIIAPAGVQPRLIPVTQIQSPSGRPGLQIDQGDTSQYQNYWLQQAQSTNYNAAFVTGDSPPRPDELSSGLNNLVRLQENWVGKIVTIKGSFIQQKRSAFATGSFPTMRKGATIPSIETTEGSLSMFNDPTNPATQNGYWTGNGSSAPSSKPGQLPYFGTPAARQWGFDVGLLSQQPDLFSQRFTQDISKIQNYYRQVGRDDPWIQTLLCAKQPKNPTAAQLWGGPGTAYTDPVVSDKDLPNCKQATNSTGAYPSNPASQ